MCREQLNQHTQSEENVPPAISHRVALLLRSAGSRDLSYQGQQGTKSNCSPQARPGTEQRSGVQVLIWVIRGGYPCTRGENVQTLHILTPETFHLSTIQCCKWESILDCFRLSSCEVAGHGTLPVYHII